MSGVEIAWAELATAFLSPQRDLTLYLDCSSGHVVELEGEPPPNDQLLEVPRLRPRDSYDDMRRFIATVRSPSLRDRLRGASQGRGAFRHFREALTTSPAEQQRWLAFRERAVHDRIAAWLREAGVEPANRQPQSAVPEPVAEPDPQARLLDLTMLLLYLGSWEEVRAGRGAVRRAWKGFRFEVLDELEQRGFLSYGRSAKSVFLTGAGVARARTIDAAIGVLPPGEQTARADRPGRRAGSRFRPFPRARPALGRRYR